MANTRRFEIEVLGDTSKAQRSLRELEGAGSKHLAGLKRYADAVVAGFAFDKIADGISSVVREARESEKVMKTTEAIIKATGGSAKMTAQQVSDLATAISNKTGIDDEQIQTASNMLLTFKNVHDEIGKGNDVFARATSAAVDLAAAGYGSMDANAKSLGRALNDPIKGVALLARQGVQFSEDQKKMIKSLVDTGDVLGAQKIMLDQVEGKVKGTAEAQATAADKMSAKWKNFQEAIGEKLLPVLDKLATWMTDKGIPYLEKMSGWIETHVVPALEKFGKWTNDHVIPALKTAWEWIHDKVLPVFENLGGWISDHWPQISSAFQSSIKTIGTVIDGLVKIGQGVVTFFKGVWKGDLDEVWAGVKQAVGKLWDGIKETFDNIGPKMGDAVKKWGPKINEKLVEAFKAVFIDLPSKLADSLLKLGGQLGGKIADAIKSKMKSSLGDGLLAAATGGVSTFFKMGSGGVDYSLAPGGVDAGADIMYARQPGSSNALAALVAAIKQQETGFLAAKGKNQYTASGPMTRYGVATGAYQFLNSTWRAWGGSTARAKDASAAEQDAVASKAIAYYMNRYGGDPTLVAIAWHAGPGAADKVASGKARASDFVDSAAHTNSGSYAANVSKYYNSYLGTVGGAAGGAYSGTTTMQAYNGKTLADIAGTLDLEKTAMQDMLDAGLTEYEAADRWRWAMLAANRDDAAAYRSIEASLGRVDDTTAAVGDQLSEALDGMSMSIEDYATGFFEGVKQLYSGNFDQAAFNRAMADSTSLGTTYQGTGDIMVDLYAKDPLTGGTLFDAAGQPIMASDTAAIAKRLQELGYGGTSTPGPSYNGPGVPGIAGTNSIGASYIFQLNGVGSDTANQLIDALRAKGMIRPDGSVVVTR